MSTNINVLNSWPESLHLKHSIWKNHETQFSINQILKDKIEKQTNYTKGSKTKK
jgi:hypothetical protein